MALERLVARLQSSKFLEGKLVFCGGFVLYKEGVTDRYTRDVDMVSPAKNQKEVIDKISAIPVIGAEKGDQIRSSFKDFINDKDTKFSLFRLQGNFQAAQFRSEDLRLVTNDYDVVGRLNATLAGNADFRGELRFRKEISDILVLKVKELTRIRDVQGRVSLPFTLKKKGAKFDVWLDERKIIQLIGNSFIQDQIGKGLQELFKR